MIGAGFVALLVDLQAVRSDELRTIGQTQRTRTRSLAAFRGRIIDRGGFVLATSTPSHQLIADPTLIVDPTATANHLAPILGIDAADLVTALTPDSDNDHYELVSRTLSEQAVLGIRDLAANDSEDLTVGLFIRPEEERVYPAGGLATPIVGRVDPDERGIFGIESLYDEAMTGVPGEEEFERSRFGSISVADWRVNPATAGYDVVLSIDHRLQFVAEEALRTQCEAMGAKGATAVLTDTKSGEVLAMAGISRDGETGRCEVPRQNAALQWGFEPGSVMKTFTMAAAMEELGYRGSTMIEVPPRISIGGVTFVDRPAHPGAPYPISQILADSMNVGTIQVAQELGPTQVHAYASRFGFGSKTGIGFEYETNGRLRPPEDWYGSDAGSMPIGQGLTVNATQLVAAYSAVANGGHYRNPVLVRSLLAPDGTEHPVEAEPAKPVVSEATAAELTRLLVGVVENGTGQAAAIPGYEVAGKTGTAWKVFEDETGQTGYGTPTDRRYVATFAGFAPAYDPAISLVVVFDEPVTNYSGGTVAAPVFAEIAEYALRLLDIAPDQPLVSDGTRVRAAPAPQPEEDVSVAGESADTESADAQAATDEDTSGETDDTANGDTDDAANDVAEDGAVAPAGDDQSEAESGGGDAGADVDPEDAVAEP
ncbi:MAG: penicillin-binding protein 2 [Actinomycetota bacterium]